MNRVALLVVRQRIDPNISIRSTLKRLHWLSVAERTEFKILTTVFKSLEYLTELLQPYTPPRTLRFNLNPLRLILDLKTNTSILTNMSIHNCAIYLMF